LVGGRVIYEVVVCRLWNVAGLPRDSVSVDSAVIMARAGDVCVIMGLVVVLVWCWCGVGVRWCRVTQAHLLKHPAHFYTL
jgi:hypothetical protein